MQNILEVEEANEEKVFRLLGLARRAGALSRGMDASINELRLGNVNLLIIAQDISERSETKIAKILDDLQIDVKTIKMSDATSLGFLMGREKCAIIGVMNEGFTQGIMKLTKE